MIFYGPTFEEVLRQYQEVFGKPTMNPLWAHGFFVKSNVPNDSQPVIDMINTYKLQEFPFQGVVMQ